MAGENPSDKFDWKIMKTIRSIKSFAPALALLGWLGIVPLAVAQTGSSAPIGYFPFNHPPGNTLYGLTNEMGQRWDAAGPAGTNVTVVAGNLIVPGLAPSSGNSIQVNGTTGPSARADFGTNVNNGALWFSFVLKVAALGDLNATGGPLAGFNPGVGATNTTPAILGTRVLTRVGGGGYQIGLAKSDGMFATWSWAPAGFLPGADPVFVVGRYSFVAGGGANDMAELWINPPAGTFGASNVPPATLTNSFGADLSQIQSFVFLQQAQGLQPTVTLADELRVGLSWASVTPPPMANLGVTSFTASPNPATQGSNVVYSVHVTNAGPNQAEGVLLSLILPNFVATNLPSNGTNTATGVDVKIGSLPPGGSATASVGGFFDVFAAEQESMNATNLATVTSQAADLAPGNNAFLIVVPVFQRRDFGDAPAPPYPTLTPNGARHKISNLILGPTIDSEPNGQPVDLDAADENGVVIPVLVPGTVVNIAITASMAGFVDAWLDYDGAAGWVAGEQVFTNLAVGAGPALYPMAVPAAAVPGNTWFRFRLSSTGGLTPIGYCKDGEVEDYHVQIVAVGGANFQVNALTATPNPAQQGETVTYTVGVSNAGPSQADGVLMSLLLPHFIATNLPPSATNTATGVDVGLGTLQAGASATVVVSGFFDVFALEVESLTVTNVASVSSSSSDSDLADNARNLVVIVNQLLDFGDAPAPPYPTLLPNGARHSRNGLFFGVLRDTEANGAASVNALGDDISGVDDEDGIVFLTPLDIGRLARIQITTSLGGRVDAWIDFNADGDWLDANEHILISAPLPAGVSVLPVPIPAAAVAGATFARFRISAGGGLAPTGFAAGGEVEDYQVNITVPPPAAPANVALAATNGSVTVNWDHPGAVLQQATSPAGPWETLPTVPNPFAAQPEGQALFFRVAEGRGLTPHALRQVNFGWLAQEADLIVDAVVSGVQNRNSTSNQADQVSWPHTFVTLDILQTLKGRTTDTNVTLRLLGGADEFDPAMIVKAAHSTWFDVGERSILFISRNGCHPLPLVGWRDGRFRVVGDQVFTEEGRPLVTLPNGKIGFGTPVTLPEIQQNLVGTNVIEMAKGLSDGENPKQPSLPGTPLTVAQFKAFLQQQIQRWNSPADLQSPVLTPSLSAAFAFTLEFPVAARPANLPPVFAPHPLGDPNPTEEAAIQANGGNPVLP